MNKINFIHTLNSNHHRRTLTATGSSLLFTPPSQLLLLHNYCSAIINNNDKCLSSHFDIIRSKPDGNCLFRSVSNALYNTQDKHLILRAKAVEWMKENMETCIDNDDDGDQSLQFKHCVFLKSSQESTDDYVKDMSRDGEWGDYSCLVALSRALHLNFKIVFVVQSDDGVGESMSSVIEVKPTSTKEVIPETDKRWIWLAYYDHVKHYDLLMPHKQIRSKL